MIFRGHQGRDMAVIAAIGERFKIGNRCLVLKNSHNIIQMLSSYCSTSYSIIPDNITIASQTYYYIVYPLICRLFLPDWSAVFTKKNREDR